MKTHISRCPICRDTVPDVTKRWVDVLGFCCVECSTFLASAEKVSRKVGIEGIAVNPVRFLPEGRES